MAKKSGNSGNRVQVNLRISADMNEEISVRSEAYGVSRNQFIVQAITAAIAASYARRKDPTPQTETVIDSELPGYPLVGVREKDPHHPYAPSVGGTPQEASRSEPIDPEQAVPADRVLAAGHWKADPNVGVPDAPVKAFADVQLRREAEASVALDGETQSFSPEEDLTEEEQWGEKSALEKADELASEQVAAQDPWGETSKHVHRCDIMVLDSVHYKKGTRYAQFRCECGHIIVKRDPKKAM